MLCPHERVVPFAGRDAELDGLVAWAAGRRRVSLRLVTGPGGVGKTRLGIELTRRLGAARWRTRWVAPCDDAAAVAEACRAPAWDLRPLLLVVDDAATAADLPALLDAAGRACRGRLRILLLARTGRAWWHRLRWACHLLARRSVVAEASALSVGTALPVAESVRSAAAAFAALLRLPPRDVVVEPAGEGPPRLLELHAAALLAQLDDGSGGPVRLRPDDALGALLDVERSAWADAARLAGLPAGEEVDDAVAAAVLLGAGAGPEGRAGALDALTRAAPALASTTGVEWLLGLDATPWPDGTAAAPGRLAELHVARRLSASPLLADSCTRDLGPAAAAHAARFACRMDVDGTRVPEAATLPMHVLRAVVPALPDDARVLATVKSVLPPPSSVLVAPVAREVARRLLDALDREEHGPAAAPADVRAAARADAWIDLARSQSDSEAYAEQAPRAVELLRGPFQRDPDRYRPLLAAALTASAVGVLRLGHHAEGERLARETVTLLEGAPPEEATWTEPHLAAALDTAGIAAGLQGRSIASDACQQAALEVERRLAARDPVWFEPGLATTLSNRFARAEHGYPEEALAAVQEATAIWRRLAHDRPDRFEQRLGYALSNLSHVLAALGRTEEAVTPAREAVTIRRRLVDCGNDSVVWELAWSLSGLGRLYSDQGRLPQAVTLEEEAVSLRRRLAAEQPLRFTDMLATSLSNLGVTYSRLGRFEEALVVEQEAVRLRRELAARTPDQFVQHLARSLTNLGLRCSDLGLLESALDPTEEAVALLRPLAAADRERFAPDLAAALATLGATRTDLGRDADAVGPATEAAELLAELAERCPGRYRAELARVLAILAVVLARVGRQDEALRHASRSVELTRELAAEDPARHAAALARSVALRDRLRAAQK